MSRQRKLLWCNELFISFCPSNVCEVLQVRKNTINFCSFCLNFVIKTSFFTDFYKIFSLCGNAAPTVSPTVSSQVECVDKNRNCHTNLCGHAFGQHQCPKTCNPKCQIKTTRAPYTRAPRPTKPPRTPKPPKIAKNIVENSPCQDNPMYKSMCGSALMKCDKTIGQGSFSYSQ